MILEDRTNEQLLTSLKSLRAKERETLSKIISHLQEIERRRAYCALGYSNLFRYLTRELGYSDSAAARRMQALKLVKRVPEAKGMIESGQINLSTAGKVNQYLDVHGDPKGVERFRQKSAAESDAILGECGIIKPKREIKRQVSETKVRVSLNLEKKTLDKFERLKNMLKKQSSNELLDELCDLALNRMEKKNRRVNKSRGSKNNRYFPAAVKKAALRRAEFTCEYAGCDEQRGLELDHVYPAALGGSNGLHNCRVLCRAHNQFAAIAVFGQEKMGRYLR